VKNYSNARKTVSLDSAPRLSGGVEVVPAGYVLNPTMARENYLNPLAELVVVMQLELESAAGNLSRYFFYVK
jgi:hypothetical protein